MSSFLGWAGLLICLLSFLRIGLDCSCAWRMSLKTCQLSCDPLPFIAAFNGITPTIPQVCFPEVHGLYSTTLLPLCPQDLELPYVTMITTTKATSDFYILNQYFFASE